VLVRLANSSVVPLSLLLGLMYLVSRSNGSGVGDSQAFGDLGAVESAENGKKRLTSAYIPCNLLFLR